LTECDDADAAERGSTLDSNINSFAAIQKRNANGTTITPRNGERKIGNGTINTNGRIEHRIQRDRS
jgi:hypothetical protein